MTRLLLALLLVVPSVGCFSAAEVGTIEASSPVTAPAAFSHDAFTAILADHVSADGLVDYAALKADARRLDAYLGTVAATDPSALPPDDRLAFWLNAYNAYALKLVVDNYPIDSILDTVGGPFIPTVNSPFSASFAVVGGERMSLDDIEHGTVREQFDEPRIHFALVCAAISCPPLRAEAYRGADLDAQLDDQARSFLLDPDKNRVDAASGTVELSKIFDWFKGDFGGSDAAVQRFVAPYFSGAEREALASASLRVRYNAYDWALNRQPALAGTPPPADD